jgi:hypothetical protein
MVGVDSIFARWERGLSNQEDSENCSGCLDPAKEVRSLVHFGDRNLGYQNMVRNIHDSAETSCMVYCMILHTKYLYPALVAW